MGGDSGGHLAYAEMELGHWQEAEAALTMALQAAADGHPFARRVAIPVRGELWLRQGRLQEALRVLEDSLPEYQAGATLLWGVWPVLALVRLALGDHAGALAAADTAVQHWRERSSPAAHERVLACAVEVYLATGHADRARELLIELAGFADRAGSSAARAYRATAAGQIAAHEGRHIEAALEFQRAADIWQAQGATHLEAQARRMRAESLLRADDPGLRAAARDQLAAAQAICTALGAVRELEEIAGIMRRYGLPVQAAHAADPQSGVLTPREREVIALIAQGCSNRAIAERLVITEKTAENHVGNILGKLGLTSRAQAAAYAVEHGLARSTTH
jgi:DNA-binding CsgD family transcriptional regulator